MRSTSWRCATARPIQEGFPRTHKRTRVVKEVVVLSRSTYIRNVDATLSASEKENSVETLFNGSSSRRLRMLHVVAA